jgi:transposase InsO family protein
MEWQRRWEAAKGGRVDMAELCRVFGVTRPTGYLWVKRFQEGGYDVRALEERSRRPHSNPRAIAETVQDFIVYARKAHPRWGPRMLRAWMADKYPGRSFPSATTIGEILKRRGLSAPRGRRMRRRVPPATAPFGEATAPNAVWCMDFKGHFAIGSGERCGPLTIIDAYSRYCIRCEIIGETTGQAVQRVLDSAFREFGLPTAFRSDNGPPFASNAPGGLSRLAVWLLRLGIRLERIAPGKPQQNGRQERFHRTLQEATANPPARSLREQQRRFDFFRREYNEERPHQALGNKPPATAYVPSTRRYPRPLVQPQAPEWSQSIRLDNTGSFRWHGATVFISSALAGEYVELAPHGGTEWSVMFGPIALGRLDTKNLKRGLSATSKRRRTHYLALNV